MAERGMVTIKLDFTKLAKVFMAGPGKFRSRLALEYVRAGRTSGAQIAALMRQKIQGGLDPANADMTRDMKGSSKTLVDTGRLFKAITHQSKGTLGDFEVRVGVKRSNAAANIARIVHDGRKQTVTRRQEVLFKMLWLASIGRKVNLRSGRAREILAKSKGTIAPIKEGKTLVIPPRPFALNTLRDPRTKLIIESEFKKALERTFRGLKR